MSYCCIVSSISRYRVWRVLVIADCLYCFVKTLLMTTIELSFLIGNEILLTLSIVDISMLGKNDDKVCINGEQARADPPGILF